MTLTTDLFLVTYPGDFAWLPYLLLSIAKYVVRESYRRLVVVLEEGDEIPITLKAAAANDGAYLFGCRRYRGTETPGYVGQQIEKLRAWHYTDADRIVILDSDEVFCRAVDLRTDPAICLEKPLLVWRRWENAGKAQCWQASTREALGFNPLGETLCRDPFVFPGWFLHLAWEVLGGEKRLLTFNAVHDYPTNHGLSEFNCLGNIALVKYADAFTPMESKSRVVLDPMTCAVDDPVLPAPCVQRFWSHHGVADQEVQDALERLGLR